MFQVLSDIIYEAVTNVMIGELVVLLYFVNDILRRINSGFIFQADGKDYF